MTSTTPIAVIGAGHSGFGLAGDLALRGFEVRLCEHPDFAETIEPVLRTGGIAVRGVTGEGHAPVALATIDAGAALDGVDLAFVVVPAYAHDAMALLLAPHVRPGLTIVLMPGNAGGAFAFRHALRAAGAPPVPVAEAASFIFACKKDGPGGVWIRGVKRGLPVGVLPAEATDAVMALLDPLYPDLVAAGDVLETSLANANHVAHPPALLLNVARIEAEGGDFSFFHEGMTPSVARLTEVIDAERMAVVAALGYAPESTLAQLTRFYGAQGFGGETYYEAVHTTPVHGAARAPSSIDHRYFTEDLPYGLVPVAAIGGALGFAMPVTNALIDLVGALSGTDFRASGRTLEVLGLVGMDAAAMRAFASTGIA